MTFAAWVLCGVGLLLCAESLWAILNPLSARERIGEAMKSSELDAGMLAGSLWGMAVALWAVAWFGQTWSHRALFLIGVYLFVLGVLFRRSGFAQQWYAFFFGNRTALTIRLLYTAELLLGLALIWVAVTG